MNQTPCPMGFNNQHETCLCGPSCPWLNSQENKCAILIISECMSSQDRIGELGELITAINGIADALWRRDFK